MATPFGLTMKRKRVDLRTLSEHQKQAGNERLHSNGSENLTKKIEREEQT
jgi:hypothetical protein